MIKDIINFHYLSISLFLLYTKNWEQKLKFCWVLLYCTHRNRGKFSKKDLQNRLRLLLTEIILSTFCDHRDHTNLLQGDSWWNCKIMPKSTYPTYVSYLKLCRTCLKPRNKCRYSCSSRDLPKDWPVIIV